MSDLFQQLAEQVLRGVARRLVEKRSAFEFQSPLKVTPDKPKDPAGAVPTGGPSPVLTAVMEPPKLAPSFIAMTDRAQASWPSLAPLAPVRDAVSARGLGVLSHKPTFDRAAAGLSEGARSFLSGAVERAPVARGVGEEPVDLAHRKIGPALAATPGPVAFPLDRAGTYRMHEALGLKPPVGTGAFPRTGGVRAPWRGGDDKTRFAVSAAPTPPPPRAPLVPLPGLSEQLKKSLAPAAPPDGDTGRGTGSFWRSTWYGSMTRPRPVETDEELARRFAASAAPRPPASAAQRAAGM